jgi:hypothetical protein
MLDRDDIVIATGPQTQKAQDIRAKPKGAVVIGGDPLDENITYQPCYLFQGNFVIEGKPEFDWITRIAYRCTGRSMSSFTKTPPASRSVTEPKTSLCSAAWRLTCSNIVRPS